MATGTGLSAVRKHFQAHGHIHALWIVSVLLAIIAALLLMVPNGESVGSYISFATSIASLVLAIVAIGQSLIANQSFSETIGSLKSSAGSVEQAAERVCDVTMELGKKSDDLHSQLADFSPTLSKVSERLDLISSPASSEPTLTSNTAASTSIIDRETHGGRIAMFLVWLSYKHKKKFNVTEVFDGLGDSSLIWAHYTAGYLTAVNIHKSLGIILEKDAEGNVFKTKDKGALDNESIYARLGRLPTSDFGAKLKKVTEEYFTKEDIETHLASNNAGDDESKGTEVGE